MNMTRTNMALAVLLLVAVVLAATMDVDRSQPNFEFLPQMKRSAASNAWSESVVFPNGRTMQAPVPGTIARGDLPLHFAATKEDAVRAGEELLNPFTFAISTAAPTEPSLNAGVSAPVRNSAPERIAGTETGSPLNAATARLQASVQHGARVYSVFCVPCHGPSGAGDGPVAKRGFPPPPPLPTGKSVQMKDGQLFHILSYGQGSMAPMAGQLSRDRRWDVINYIRSLQQGVASTALTNPSAPAEGSVPSDAPFPVKETLP